MSKNREAEKGGGKGEKSGHPVSGLSSECDLCQKVLLPFLDEDFVTVLVFWTLICLLINVGIVDIMCLTYGLN